jgi:DNA-binding MarR family transcriptional regulator
MSTPSDDLLRQTIDSFWESVPPVWNTVRSYVRSTAIHEFEITEEQFHILRHIRKGSHSASQLAEIGRISRPAVSQALDALVRRGLVSRQQSTGDRRYVQLDLTAAGAALLDEVFGQARQWMKSRLLELEPDDLQAVMSGLAVLKAAICD